MTALLVGIVDSDPIAAEASLRELQLLLQGLDVRVSHTELVHLRNPHPAWLLGSGTASRIAQLTDEHGVDILAFDTEINATHQRNWQRRTGTTVTDRHGVILEVFFRRAHTREAKLQVELAQARYDARHAGHAWTHLSRQGGGSRLARGEGEKQLEMDKRRAQERITKLQRRLDVVAKQRSLRRSRRSSMARVALVGYTNAGKSTLLNALSGANAVAADRLFATLDPLTRRVALDAETIVTLTDTVGFIQKLPPALVDAFHSTLEEALEADCVLYVLDASDPLAARRWTTVYEVMRSLGAHARPAVIALNKIDMVTSPPDALFPLEHLVRERWPMVPVSAKTGAGLTDLRAAVAEVLSATTLSH